MIFLCKKNINRVSDKRMLFLKRLHVEAGKRLQMCNVLCAKDKGML